MHNLVFWGIMLFQLLLRMLFSRWKQVSIFVALLSLSTFLILEQVGSFKAALRKTSSLIQEIQGVDIWVMDPEFQLFKEQRGISREALTRIQKIQGIRFASPLYLGEVHVHMGKGGGESFRIIGLDDATLVGAPVSFRMGNIHNLSMESGVILGDASLKKRGMAVKKEIRMGSKVLVNQAPAHVVGVAKQSTSTESLLYTTFSRAKEWTHGDAGDIPLVVVKVADKHEIERIAKTIEKKTNLKAFTEKSFTQLILSSYLKEARLPSHFSWFANISFIVALCLSLGILLSAADIFHKNLVIFRTIGASYVTIAGSKLLITLLISCFSWMLGSLLYFGVYTVARGSTELPPLLGETLLYTFMMMTLLSLLISMASAFKIKEMTREIL